MRASLTQRELASRIERDQSSLSRWEKGERAPNDEDVKQYLTGTGTTGQRRDEILSMVKGITAPSWLALTLPEQHVQMAALLRFERQARRVTHVAPLLIPGVLQTSDYTRTLMESGDISADEIETQIAVRVGRRELITREAPAMLRALLGEAALRQGNPKVLAKQLRYLVEMADYPNIEIRVVGFTAGWMEGMFALIETDDESPIAHVDVGDSSLFLHEPSDVDHYRRKAAVIEEMAMNPEESKGFMADIAREMEATR